MKSKKVYYWSPSLVNIATNRAVINSAYSLGKYKSNYECAIINFFGEFSNFKDEIFKKKINLINHFNNNIYKFFPRHGKIKSRISFILIFIFSFFPLKNILKNHKPEFLVIHLITSLPLLLMMLFDYKTKFILRVSGYPKLGFFRKILWKLAAKKLHMITCPTNGTYDCIKKSNLIESDKIKLLYDPILEIRKFSKKNVLANIDNLLIDNFYFAAGRLTKQKNFLFLCKSFNKILKKYPNEKLFIAGEGEDRNKIYEFIEKNRLEKNIILLGIKDNISQYMEKAKGFILSSLWEDPGFVLIEAAMMKTFVLSSNCLNGPNEIIKDNYSGVSFKNDDQENFIEKFNIFYNLNKTNNKNLLINNLKGARKFTIFNHYKMLTKILEID